MDLMLFFIMLMVLCLLGWNYVDSREKWKADDLAAQQKKRDTWNREELAKLNAAQKQFVTNGLSKLNNEARLIEKGGADRGALEKYIGESAELRGLSFDWLVGDKAFAEYAEKLTLFRESYLFPLLETEMSVYDAAYDLELLRHDGDVYAARQSAQLYFLKEMARRQREALHEGLWQLRLSVQNLILRHRGFSAEEAKERAEELHSGEPRVYRWFENLIYVGPYIQVPSQSRYA
jgi:hypothetical protein